MPNEAAFGKVIYSGIAVQLVKTDNLLQLFNPAAPLEYGRAEDNTVWDPITGKASGLKFLSISF